MVDLFKLLPFVLLSFFLPLQSLGETKELVCDFTKEQSLPEGWNMGKNVNFKNIDGVNCLYVNSPSSSAESRSIYTNVFYKITKIKISVKEYYSNKNSGFIISFFRPEGGTELCGFTYNNPDTGISDCVVEFNDGAEYMFPADVTNYVMCINCAGVAISRIAITYEERPAEEEKVSSFIFKNYYGRDDADISGDRLSVNGVEVKFSNNVKYLSGLFYAELTDGENIQVLADNIVRIDVSTAFFNKVVSVNGVELEPYEGNGIWVSRWDGVSDRVEITPPGGGTSSITAIAVYTKEKVVTLVEGNLSAIIKNGVVGNYYKIGLPLQGVAIGEAGKLYARTVSDDACTDISQNETDGSNIYDDDVNDFIQRDWIALDFNGMENCNASNYVGRCLSAGIVGVLSEDTGMPTLNVITEPVIDTEAIIDNRYNRYSIRNFYGDKQTGAFVVKPQINEVAYVSGTVDAENGNYVICDENGSLTLDNVRGIIENSHIGCEAVIEGIVQLTDTEVKDYELYVLGVYANEHASVKDGSKSQTRIWVDSGNLIITSDAMRSEIFNISGHKMGMLHFENTRQSSMPLAPGYYLVKLYLNDGRTEIHKVLVNQN